MKDSTGLFEDYKRVQDGRSLARLLEHHQKPVLRICRRVLRHPQDAEDAAQEVLLEVSRQAGTIQEPGAFSGWLYRTALHTALDHRRKRGRDRLREGKVRAIAPTRVPRDLNESLYEGLERLDEPSRALIVEHYLAGRPLRELAAERGCSEVAIWKRLRTLRERLRSNIGSAAMAALENSGSGLWGQLLGLKGISTMSGMKWAIAAPLGLSALVGVVLIARSAEPSAPELPRKQTVATLPRLVQPPPAPRPPAPPPVLPKPVEPAPAPKAPAPGKPYPYKVPAPAAPGGAVWAWTVLSRTKVTLDEQDASLPQFLADISRQTGLRFSIDADLPKLSLSITVAEIVADGALRLLFGPARMDYEIQTDGTIRVGSAEDIQGGFERTARAAEAPLRDLAAVAEMMDAGWDGLRNPSDRSPQIEAALARKIVIPHGESTLQKEIDRLTKSEGVHMLMDGVPAENAPFLQAVEERSLRAHLEQLAVRAGLVLVASAEDIFLLTTPEKAADLRSKEEAERTVYESTLKVFSTPLPDGGTFRVQDFAEAVQAARGIPVIPSEAAWNSSASFSLPLGSTLRQGLDALKTQGFRWALHDGKLYILK